MKLYAVTDHKTATALREKRPLNYTRALMLDSFDGGVERVGPLTWYAFPWLCDVIEEDAGENLDFWDKWEEIIVDVPEDLIKAYEYPCSEGGNSTWHLPRSIIDSFLVNPATDPQHLGR